MEFKSIDELRAFYRQVTSQLASKKILAGWVDGNGTARVAYENLQTRNKTGKATPSIKQQPSNALIARTLNYGREEGTTAEGKHYPTIPARPFMTYAFEAMKKRIKELQREYIPKILLGEYTAEQLCTRAGSDFKDEIVKAIRDSSKYAPVSAATLARRRHHGSTSAVPLIDSGQMVGSVSFEVRDATLQSKP